MRSQPANSPPQAPSPPPIKTKEEDLQDNLAKEKSKAVHRNGAPPVNGTSIPQNHHYHHLDNNNNNDNKNKEGKPDGDGGKKEKNVFMAGGETRSNAANTPLIFRPSRHNAPPNATGKAQAALQPDAHQPPNNVLRSMAHPTSNEISFRQQIEKIQHYHPQMSTQDFLNSLTGFLTLIGQPPCAPPSIRLNGRPLDLHRVFQQVIMYGGYLSCCQYIHSPNPSPAPAQHYKILYSRWPHVLYALGYPHPEYTTNEAFVNRFRTFYHGFMFAYEQHYVGGIPLDRLLNGAYAAAHPTSANTANTANSSNTANSANTCNTKGVAHRAPVGANERSMGNITASTIKPSPRAPLATAPRSPTKAPPTAAAASRPFFYKSAFSAKRHIRSLTKPQPIHPRFSYAQLALMLAGPHVALQVKAIALLERLCGVGGSGDDFAGWVNFGSVHVFQMIICGLCSIYKSKRRLLTSTARPPPNCTSEKENENGAPNLIGRLRCQQRERIADIARPHHSDSDNNRSTMHAIINILRNFSVAGACGGQSTAKIMSDLPALYDDVIIPTLLQQDSRAAIEYDRYLDVCLVACQVLCCVAVNGDDGCSEAAMAAIHQRLLPAIHRHLLPTIHQELASCLDAFRWPLLAALAPFSHPRADNPSLAAVIIGCNQACRGVLAAHVPKHTFVVLELLYHHLRLRDGHPAAAWGAEGGDGEECLCSVFGVLWSMMHTCSQQVAMFAHSIQYHHRCQSSAQQQPSLRTAATIHHHPLFGMDDGGLLELILLCLNRLLPLLPPPMGASVLNNRHQCAATIDRDHIVVVIQLVDCIHKLFSGILPHAAATSNSATRRQHERSPVNSHSSHPHTVYTLLLACLQTMISNYTALLASSPTPREGGGGQISFDLQMQQTLCEWMCLDTAGDTNHARGHSSANPMACGSGGSQRGYLGDAQMLADIAARLLTLVK